MPGHTETAAHPDPPRLHLVLVEPEIAGNTGAIGRTCVATGAMLWLVRPLGFLLDDRHRRRAGLDYWDQLRWQVVDSTDQAVAAIAPGRFWSFSTRGERVYTEARYRPGDALVFGAESRGLPDRWLQAQPPDQVVRIPTRPGVRSLNISVAAAVGAFEAIRQFDCGG